MQAALKAALAYLAVVFAAGFALGTLRVLFVAPRIGPVAAVLIESPVMLGISWIIARALIARFVVPDRLEPRLVMGAVALMLLLAGEAALAVLAFGRTLQEHLAGYGTVAGAIGLAMQVVFGTFPLLQRRRP